MAGAFSDLLKYAPDAPVASVTADSAAAPQAASSVGDSPFSPIPESPLSVMERGMLGWVRTSGEQEKLLKGYYGSDNVQKLPTESGGQRFSVKHQGKWFDADPAFEWKNLVTPSRFGENVKDVAQDLGEYGLRGMGAGLGAAALGGAAMLAVPVAAVGVPVALAATGAATAFGAMAGGAGAEALDMGTRQVMEPNPETPGARLARNPKEVMDQLGASMLMGLEAETFGMGMKLGLKGATSVVGGIIKRVSNTPEGRAAVAKIFSFMGADERLTQARLQNPNKTAIFDEMAAKDSLKPFGQTTLDQVEADTFDRVEQGVDTAVKRGQLDFARLGANPKVKASRIDLTSPFEDAAGVLKDSQRITDSGAMMQNRVYSPGDEKAIKFIMSNASNSADGLSYNEARALQIDTNTLLKGSDQLSPPVVAALMKLKKGTHGSIVTSLGDDLGVEYDAIVNKYSGVKALQDEWERLSSQEKRSSFFNKLMGDKKDARALYSDLIGHGVDEEKLLQLYQIQSAREATQWFGNSKIAKLIPGGRMIPSPGSRLGAAAITAGSEIKQGIMDTPEQLMKQMRLEKMLPYADKAIGTLKKLPVGDRLSVLKSPVALDTLVNSIGESVMDEEVKKSQLLKDFGVVR